MGLILLPLLAAWLAGAGYSVIMWYAILTGDNPVSYSVSVLGCGFLLALAYLYFGLSRFKSKDEVWAFEIPMFFLMNKYVLSIYILTGVVYFSGWNIPDFPHTPAVCFILAFAGSVGAVVGTFYADSFLKKHDIGVTY